MRAAGRNCLLYLVTTFANPTGRCLDRAEPKQLLQVAASHGVTVIDDDVYRDTCRRTAVDVERSTRRVLRLGSFSKSIWPGLRVGYRRGTARRRRPRSPDAGCSTRAAAATTSRRWWWARSSVPGASATICAPGSPPIPACREALSTRCASAVHIRRAHGRVLRVVALARRHGLGSTFVAAAQDNGVLVSDGRKFFAGEPDAGYVRVSFSMLDEDVAARGRRGDSTHRASSSADRIYRVRRVWARRASRLQAGVRRTSGRSPRRCAGRTRVNPRRA